jgi:CheY-like chemotaxis protein
MHPLPNTHPMSLPPPPFQPADAIGLGAPLPRLLGPGGRRWKALLADDNPINREVGIALLEELGLQVETAIDGHEAVRKTAAGQFDLVLMDMQMPRLDGLSATRELRALPAGSTVPVIAMTANAFEQSRVDCLAAGMNDFVAKPVDLRKLATTLARWLPDDRS